MLNLRPVIALALFASSVAACGSDTRLSGHRSAPTSQSTSSRRTSIHILGAYWLDGLLKRDMTRECTLYRPRGTFRTCVSAVDFSLLDGGGHLVLETSSSGTWGQISLVVTTTSGRRYRMKRCAREIRHTWMLVRSGRGCLEITSFQLDEHSHISRG